MKVRWVDTVVRGCGSSLLIASIFSMKYRTRSSNVSENEREGNGSLSREK